MSCAHWLNFKCGVALGAAREKVRVARALEQLPKLAAAMGRGAVSYSKARAITRIASSENEDYLLSIALARNGSPRREAGAELSARKGRRGIIARGAAVCRARRPPSLRCRRIDGSEGPAPGGNWRAADQGAGCCDGGNFDARRSRWNVQGERAHAEPADERPTRAARRADALAVLAETFIKHGGARAQRRRASSDRGACRCRDPAHRHGRPMRNRGARRHCLQRRFAGLACDCSVVAVIENDRGEPLNVGRKTRSIPPALRRALNARDRGCRFPGCTHTRYVDAHHVRHWAHGGETKASNLVTLCRFHHRKVHEGWCDRAGVG